MKEYEQELNTLEELDMWLLDETNETYRYYFKSGVFSLVIMIIAIIMMYLIQTPKEFYLIPASAEVIFIILLLSQILKSYKRLIIEYRYQHSIIFEKIIEKIIEKIKRTGGRS